MVAEIHHGNPYNVGVDCAILMNPQTWVASGHLGGFADPLMDCKECHERFRADKLIEDYAQEKGITLEKPIDAFSQEEMKAFVEDNNIPCPTCGKHNFTDIRQFNLMFKTFQGVTEDAKNTVYLRPETAQGILSTSKMCRDLPARRSRLVSVRSVNPSVMRSHRVTSHSVQESLNRWSLNFSVSPVQIWNGSGIGEASAVTGCLHSALKKMRCVCVTMIRKSFASIPRVQPISSSSSRLDGVSSGVLQTEQTTT